MTCPLDAADAADIFISAGLRRPVDDLERIGKKLVEILRGHLGEEVMRLLLSAPSAMGYYPLLGFEQLECAFEIRRSR